MSVGSKGSPVQQRVTAGQSPVGAVLTLRDFFAAHAPTPHFAWVHSQESSSGKTFCQVLAAHAYEYADAMLAERERTS